MNSNKGSDWYTTIQLSVGIKSEFKRFRNIFITFFYFKTFKQWRKGEDIGGKFDIGNGHP